MMPTQVFRRRPAGAEHSGATRGDPARCRFVNGLAMLVGIALFWGPAATLIAADEQPGCSHWNQPADADSRTTSSCSKRSSVVLLGPTPRRTGS
jgi:hypothetical protein